MGCLLSSFMVGLMAIASKRTYATHHGISLPRSAAARVPVPTADHCWPLPLQETLKHSEVGLAQSLWGLWFLVCRRFCLSPLSISSGYEFDSKRDFAPPTVLSGLLLCPWMWGIFFWWDPTFSCWWLFSSDLQFWSSCRRRWALVFLLCHLRQYQCCLWLA